MGLGRKEEGTHGDIVQAYLLGPRRLRRTAVLEQDTVPPSVVGIRQCTQDTLVRVDAAKEKSSSAFTLPPAGVRRRPGSLQVPPERLLWAPHARHPILVAAHVLRAGAQLQWLVNVGIPLPGDEAAPLTVAEIRA